MKTGDVVNISSYGVVKAVKVIAVSRGVFVFLNPNGSRGWAHKESVIS
jgi:hypothetical protein